MPARRHGPADARDRIVAGTSAEHAADPTFRQLLAAATTLGARVVAVPVDADLRHDLDAMHARIGADTGLVYVVNPNNPTGTVVAADRLRAFLTALPKHTVAVVDEAYLELVAPGATESTIDLVRAAAPVIVMRTFSKVHGLAGLRVGYALADPAIAKTLRRWPPTLPATASLRAARASLDDREFLQDCARRIVADRRRMERAFDARGWRYGKSEGNFLFVDAKRPGARLATELAARGVSIGRPVPGWDGWSRISVGTTREVDALLAALPT